MLAGYQDQRCLVPTNSASIVVVWRGLEAFELRRELVFRNVTVQIRYLSIKCRTLFGISI